MNKQSGAQYLIAFLVLTLTVIFFFTYPIRNKLEELRQTINCGWFNFCEPENALNRHIQHADRNMNIRLPVMDHGLVSTNVDSTALFIELDERGRFSIHNASMSEKILDTILKNRIAKYHQFGCFIWADKRVSEKARNDLINKLTKLGLSSIYLVGIREKSNHKDIDYVVTPYSPAD